MPHPGERPEEIEIYKSRRAIETYNRLDPSLPLGNIPRQQTSDLLSMCDAAEMLSPDERLGHAWLQLEHLLATLADEKNGVAGVKDVNVARQDARGGFNRIAKDAALPAQIRAKAMVAAASVPLYENAYLRGGYGSKHLVHNNYRHMEALQNAARLMLDEFDEDDVQYMNELTAEVLFAECAVDNAWFLPAATRQPWAITAVSHNPNRLGLHVAIGTTERTDVLAISPGMLGHGEWHGAAQPAFDVLQAYTQFTPGYYTSANRAPRKQWPRMNQIRDFMDVVADRVYTQLNGFTGDTAPDFGLVGRKEATTSEASDGSATTETVLTPEARWYALQSSADTVADLGPAFTLNLHNLEEQYAEGTLSSRDRHVLAWMQREYAQHVWESAQEPDLEEVNTRLDTAIALCLSAAESYKGNNLQGNTCDALLDMEGMIVYKALINGGQKEVKEAVAAYCRKVANMFIFIRDNQRTMRGNADQLLNLALCSERAALTLLLTAATDEDVDHHLAVPAPPRTTNPAGRVDMLVFTANAMEDRGYTPTDPVRVQFTEGGETSYQKRFVTIGRDLLAPPKQPLETFKKLSAVARDKKGKEKRPASINDLCVDLAMLIVDADEA